jgi:hypothetical protein
MESEPMVGEMIKAMIEQGRRRRTTDDGRPTIATSSVIYWLSSEGRKGLPPTCTSALSAQVLGIGLRNPGNLSPNTQHPIPHTLLGKINPRGGFDQVCAAVDHVRAGVDPVPDEFDQVPDEFDHVRAGVDRVGCRRGAAGATIDQVEAIKITRWIDRASVDP